MKQYKIILAQKALKDLTDIHSYITTELQEPSAADRLITKFKSEISSLNTMPERHALVAEQRLAIQGIRKMLVDNYLVFYLVTGEEVRIIRVLHAKRDWVNLL